MNWEDAKQALKDYVEQSGNLWVEVHTGPQGPILVLDYEDGEVETLERLLDALIGPNPYAEIRRETDQVVFTDEGEEVQG